jgi:hypothetical protein
MDPNQIDSYRRSIKLYESILLKAREEILQNPPPHLFPLPHNELQNPNKMAVIIDPRYDNLMEAVILNFMHFMVPEGWHFTIISAEQHKQAIQQRFPQAIFMELDNCLLYYTQNPQNPQNPPQPQLSIQNYNAILTSPEFWNKIPCEKITIFQKDCVMYRMFSEEWSIKYAYSGARCFDTITTDSSLINGIINGGFSIRNKTAMLNCIKHITWETIELYRKNNFTCHQYFPIKKKNEDIFFTYACEILHYPLPQLPIHKQLAIECEFFLGACVFHGWTKEGYQLETWAREILSHSPFFSQYLSQIPPDHPPTPQSPPKTQSQNPEENIQLQIFILPDKSQPEIFPYPPLPF